MKRVFIFLFSIVFLCGCDNITDIREDSLGINYNITVDYDDVNVKTVNIEGHKYVVATLYKSTGAGISIIHAESCECKLK